MSSIPTTPRRDPASREPVQAVVVLHDHQHWPVVAAAAIASARLAAGVSALAPAQQGSFWSEWLEGRFTKSVRRAKGPSQLSRIMEELDSLGIRYAVSSNGAATALAIEPMPYAEFLPSVRRLQVSGLDLEQRPREVHSTGLVGEHPSPYVAMVYPEAYDGAERTEAGEAGSHGLLTTGKAAAQAAHALVVQVLAMEPDEKLAWSQAPSLWLSGSEVPPTTAEHRVVDAGLTETAPGTLTAVSGMHRARRP